jgi:hypothetical protein
MAHYTKVLNYQKDNCPLSFRVDLETHAKYKKLPSMRKKEINYKFNKWIKKQVGD